MVKNLPANAGDMGLIPDLGRYTRSGATKPVCHNYGACVDPTCHNLSEKALEPSLCNKRSHGHEKLAHHN